MWIFHLRPAPTCNSLIWQANIPAGPTAKGTSKVVDFLCHHLGWVLRGRSCHGGCPRAVRFDSSHCLFSSITWWKGCDRSEGNQSSWHNGFSSAAPLESKNSTFVTFLHIQVKTCRRHVLHAIGAVVGVHLVAHTEATSDHLFGYQRLACSSCT